MICEKCNYGDACYSCVRKTKKELNLWRTGFILFAIIISLFKILDILL
jgi:hypothetical protein